MRIPPDLVPQKVVAADLCVSIVTLWRARKSGLPDFPEPVILKSMVFWRKNELQKLEDALMRFRGRLEFEKHRKAEEAAAAVRRVRATTGRRKIVEKAQQRDLFE